MSKILIKGGQIILEDSNLIGDVLIVNEKIEKVGPHINEEVNQIIDATNYLVFPGGIDAHVHMNVPCSDGSVSTGYDSETLAAACGGTTTIIDYVLQDRDSSAFQLVTELKQKAEQESYIDFGFHLIVTNPKVLLKELDELTRFGITSFKLFMANDLSIQDEELLRLLTEIKNAGSIACIHAENKWGIEYLQKIHAMEGKLEPYYHALSRPVETELEAINRALLYRKLSGCPMLIAHISSREGLKLVQEAKMSGEKIFAESCSHYLILDDTKYQLGNYETAKYVISPPLRSKDEVQKLRSGFISGEVDIISSDHNGFSYATHKQIGNDDYRKIPNGSPGIEHRFNLAYHVGVKNGLKLNEFANIIATNPAKIFGLYPQKGTIKPGSDADIVIFNPNSEHIITAKNQKQDSDYTPYEGIAVKGKVETVINKGRLIVDKGQIVGQKGSGKYLVRKPFVQ